MNQILMAGVDHETAGVEVRERFALLAGKIQAALLEVYHADGVEGCVLLSTCNRTELYLSAQGEVSPAALLCAAAGAQAKAEQVIVRRRADAASHLIEVACGMRSRILGEDQIITQVREAADAAREAGTADSLLQSLFRTAVTAGKEVKTRLRIRGVPLSAAHSAVAFAEQKLGPLAGKRALVIGNGEMGRLACRLLADKGAEVTVTLRSYRHGETVVPSGCKASAYEARLSTVQQSELVISATTSPHFTLHREQLAALATHPRLLIDLALPRDIDPAAGEILPVYNIDDICLPDLQNVQALEKAREIAGIHAQKFEEWTAYRAALPVIEQIKQAACVRVSFDPDYVQACAGQTEMDEAVQIAVEKTVDMLLGSMKHTLQPEHLEACLAKIQRGLRVSQVQGAHK